jgi:pilus assembly protein CpaF
MRSFIDEESRANEISITGDGLRPFDLSNPELVAERAYRNLTGYGPLGPLLADDDVWEIIVNAPDGAFS